MPRRGGSRPGLGPAPRTPGPPGARGAERRGGAPDERCRGVEDRAPASDRLAEHGSVGHGVDESDAVAVDGPEEHHEPRELEERLPLGLRARTEDQAGRVLEDQEQRHLPLLCELFSVRLPEARGDIPVDVADVVPELVPDNLVELDAPAAEGRAVLAAEDVLDRMAEPPLTPA